MMEEATTKKVIDPVCGMKVDRVGNPLKCSYQNHDYFFCAEGCKKAFKSNPMKYVECMEPRKKGIWARYLERLAKTTGGQAMKCH